MSMLINGEVNIEGKCSPAVLTLSGMVTYNTDFEEFYSRFKPSSS